MLDIYCIGTAIFGALMGYFFGWSVKQQKPNSDEITMLLSTVLGGTVTSLLAQFHCAAALPVYIVGVVVGVALYFVLLRFNWPSIADAMDNGALERPPVMPWRVPAVMAKPSEPAPVPPCPCNKSRDGVEVAKPVPTIGVITPRLASDSVTFGYDSVGRLQTVTYANGTVITYNYDAMGNRTSVVTTCSGGGC